MAKRPDNVDDWTDEQIEEFRLELRADVKNTNPEPYSQKTPEERKKANEELDRIMAALSQAFEQSGMTEEELVEEIRLGREEHHLRLERERQAAEKAKRDPEK